MKKFIFLLGCMISLPVSAVGVELVQIMTFQWDAENKELRPVSLGSGTAISSNEVLTNAHVVTNKDGSPADFVLLCPAKVKSTYSVDCNIPAGVIAVHDTLDAALVRPISPEVYLPQVQTSLQNNIPGDRIRIYGFPISTEEFENFGDSTALTNLQNWAENGGELPSHGDRMTVTRGNISNIGHLKVNDEDLGVYYLTNVKVNYGNSGGGAFDENQQFVGIPTLRDKEFNALVLAYPQLQDWIAQHENIAPDIPENILSAYNKKLKNSSSEENLQKKSSAQTTRSRYTLRSQITNQDSIQSIQDRYSRFSLRRRTVTRPSVTSKDEKRRSQRGAYRALR